MDHSHPAEREAALLYQRVKELEQENTRLHIERKIIEKRSGRSDLDTIHMDDVLEKQLKDDDASALRIEVVELQWAVRELAVAIEKMHAAQSRTFWQKLWQR